MPNVGARVSILSIKGELIGRVGGRFAGEKPGEFVAPARRARSTRAATSTWPRCRGRRKGSTENAAARDPLAAEVREGMSRLDEAGVAAALRAGAGLGARRARRSRGRYRFADFRAALAFVNRVGELAERAGHHPDIDIRYNTVTLTLCTHDAGGLTTKDFELARAIDRA